jgi:hypothetical protein
MSKQEKKSRVTFEIVFPQAHKIIKRRRDAFTSFLNQIEENKNQWGVEVRPTKSKNRIFIGSRELHVFMVFRKLIAVEMAVNEPDTNKNVFTANEMGKNIISTINTILGDGAKGSMVTTKKRIFYGETSINFNKRIIGKSRIAKINEQAGQTLTPYNTMFDYLINEKRYLVSFTEGSESVLSYRRYKNEIPVNLLEIEYSELENPTKVIEKLANMKP